MRTATVLCVAVLAFAAIAVGAEEWRPLFNGKDLEGWKATDASKFKVEDGCLVGFQEDGKGADIFTTERFEDFELRFTYRVKWPANSGVWFRDRYQFDILKWKRPKTFSGALYYPGCKGTFAFKNLNESLEKRDGWNHAQVYANGDHIIFWLNGRKIGETHDQTFDKGRIGVQVHGGGHFKG
ncbi:MAG: 3-keto-disaccharide hydrolase, partial [Planctomycetota bacterium]